MKSVLKYSITGSAFAVFLVVAAVSAQSGSFEVAAQEGMGGHGLGAHSMDGHNTIPAQSISDRLYVVHISSGDPDSEHQRHSSMMGIHHAKAFQDAGKHVVVFLDVDGVRIADDNRPTVLTVQHATLVEFLRDGGRVIACEHCVANAGVDELVQGVEVDPHPFMPKYQRVLTSADVVLDY